MAPSCDTDVILKSGENTMTNLKTIKRRLSAFLPRVMSSLALILVSSYVALFGVIHEADERAAAHIWQILMVMQIPIIAFFALKYVPQEAKAGIPGFHAPNRCCAGRLCTCVLSQIMFH